MRRVLKAHRSEVLGVETWAKASALATGKGTERTGDELEAWLEQQVEIYQEKIRKAVGPKLASNPDMMARVMERYCGKNFPAVFHSAKQLGLMDMDQYADEFGPDEFDF